MVTTDVIFVVEEHAYKNLFN